MDTDYKKRRAARQKRIRQRRMLITFMVFLIIGLISVIVMCFTTFFPVKQVKVVSGSKIYSNEQIITASRLVNDKKQLLSFSSKKLKTTIQGQLPYIEQISIDRKFPDTVEIKVTDSHEVAHFKADKKYYVLSESDRVLKIEKKAPENTYEIITKNGISGQLGKEITYNDTKEKELVNDIVSKLKDNGIKINKIDIKNTVAIAVRVEDKFDVNLGRNEYLNRKIDHLASMIEEIGDRSGKINLGVWTPQNKHGIFDKD